MRSKNKDIIFGSKEIDELELHPRHVKIRITTMVDEDVLKALKKLAKSSGQKYQTVINQVLRNFVERRNGDKVSPIAEKRVREIVREELRKKA